jgi:hypothetical protein
MAQRGGGTIKFSDLIKENGKFYSLFQLSIAREREFVLKIIYHAYFCIRIESTMVI